MSEPDNRLSLTDIIKEQFAIAAGVSALTDRCAGVVIRLVVAEVSRLREALDKQVASVELVRKHELTTPTRLPLIPETLDDACHCGFYPEGGDPVYGSKCPIIEHRARSGTQWRQHYIEEFNDSRELRTDVSRLQQENATLQQQLKSEKQERLIWSNESKMLVREKQTIKAECAKALEENALLRRSLEMLTQQLDEKDERIVELETLTQM